MPAAPVAQTLVAEPVVLIVHVNFAVAISMAQRLMESCLVTLAPTALAATSISRLEASDVVVLCPYLTDAERERLLDACAALDCPPAVVEVSDKPGSGGTVVRVVSLPSRPDARTTTALAALVPTAA
jgi:hypothetical protein